MKYLMILTTVLLISCSTTDLEPGRLWEGQNSHSRWELAVDKNSSAAVMTMPFPFKGEIRGEAYAAGDEWVFHTDEMYLFYTSTDGWNEILFSLQGMIRLTEQGDSWVIRIEEQPRILSVKDAEVRYKRERYYDDRAKDLMSRRLTRLEALAPHANELLGDKTYDYDLKRKGYWSKAWVKDLRELLIPEVYGYNDDQTLESQDGKSVQDENRYLRNEGILWDTWYTRSVFPEEFREIRNSGTLYRDMEEALPLLFLLCRWDDYWNDFLSECEIRSLM